MPAYTGLANRDDLRACGGPELACATEKARYTSSNSSLQSSCVTPTKNTRLLYQMQSVQRLGGLLHVVTRSLLHLEGV